MSWMIHDDVKQHFPIVSAGRSQLTLQVRREGLAVEWHGDRQVRSVRRDKRAGAFSRHGQALAS
jgi:hypothetical protein